MTLERAITEHADEEIVVLRVIEVAGGSLGGIDLVKERLKEERDETTAAVSEELLDRLEKADVEYRTETVVGRPGREIVSFAETHDIDEIILGSHGRAVGRFVLLEPRLVPLGVSLEGSSLRHIHGPHTGQRWDSSLRIARADQRTADTRAADPYEPHSASGSSTLREGEDVVLVRAENPDNRCRRHLPVDVIADCV